MDSHFAGKTLFLDCDILDIEPVLFISRGQYMAWNISRCSQTVCWINKGLIKLFKKSYEELENIVLECLSIDLKYIITCTIEKSRTSLDFHELDIFPESK